MKTTLWMCGNADSSLTVIESGCGKTSVANVNSSAIVGEAACTSVTITEDYCFVISTDLHRNFYDVLTSRVGDHSTIDGLAIKGDGLHTLLGTIRMDGNLVVSLAEFTINGIIGSCLRQTWINADTIVIGFDTQDELRNGVPHPSCCTCKP